MIKRSFCIVFILMLWSSLSFGLSGYSNHKVITIHGSSAGTLASGSEVQIRVCPDADPVQVGSWSVNSKTYRYRIPIAIQEVSHTTPTNYLVWFELHTDILVQRGFFPTSPTPQGYEVEFSDGSTNFSYNVDTSMFNGPRTRYFVQMSLAANASTTIYMYFDPLIPIIPTQSGNYSTGLTYSSTVPDNQYLPKVNVPLLLPDQTVYLDGECSSFPYDVAFTASDGTTKLTWNDTSETLHSDINNSILFNVKLSSAVPQSGSLDINVWFNGSQTSRDANWTNTNAHIFYDDFESGTSLWTKPTGTWTTADQQVPIYKGGPCGWSRAPLVVQSGSKYYLYTDSALDWGVLSTYGGISWYCKLPWTGWDTNIGTSMSDFLYEHFWSFDDRPANSRGWNAEGGTQIYMNSVVQDANGTYWATYTNASNGTSGENVFLASSTDLITWTPSANNPIIPNSGNYPPNTPHQVGGSYLFGIHQTVDGSCILFQYVILLTLLMMALMEPYMPGSVTILPQMVHSLPT